MEIHDSLMAFATAYGCTFDGALEILLFGVLIAIGGWGFCLYVFMDFGIFLYERCAKPLFKKIVNVLSKKNSAPGKERRS